MENTGIEDPKCIKIVVKLHDKLAAFINQSQVDRTWLKVAGAKVYVRKTKRHINNVYVDTFTIASISIDKQYQNKGIFKAFLQSVFISNKDNNKVIYIESVLNNILANYLEQNNWQGIYQGLVEDRLFMDCYYLPNPLNTVV